MVRKSIAFVAVCGALVLGGCNSPSTGSLADQLKGAISTACGYQVSADTALQLAGLFAGTFFSGSSALTSFVAATVDGVCATVKSTAPQARAGMAAPVYRGVVIRPQ